MKKISFKPKVLEEFFTYKAIEMCKSCKRYGKKATCPPNIADMSYYKKLLPTYQKGILLIKKFNIDDPKNWERLGKESSLVIHKELLKMRKNFLHGNTFPIIFGAGSCKNCSKCGFPCKFPEKSIVPIEGTGLDVIGIVSAIAKIEIKFPVEKQGFFYRIGIILYD